MYVKKDCCEGCLIIIRRFADKPVWMKKTSYFVCATARVYHTQMTRCYSGLTSPTACDSGKGLMIRHVCSMRLSWARRLLCNYTRTSNACYATVAIILYQSSASMRQDSVYVYKYICLEVRMWWNTRGEALQDQTLRFQYIDNLSN